MRFALNRTVAPTRSLGAFLSLAAEVGAEAVEVRNDVPGREFADGTPAKDLVETIGAAGLKVASINALQRFNDWTPEREREARALIRYAADLRAPGLVMCPVIDAHHGWSASELEAKLREALRALKPIYADHGITGYVEPLGMVDSTLRHQAPAVAAIGDVDGFAHFTLCHDTFQYYRSRDTDLQAAHVGLVHISGITRRSVDREALVEPDRGLVGADDICGNIDQLRRLFAAGYRGYVSVEPFDPAVQANPRIAPALAASLDYVREKTAQ
jgi:2-keto-myo-inositol isomerase